MKVFHLKKTWFVCVVLLFCFAVYALLSVAGYLFNCKYISVMAAISQADNYQIRSELLMEAMNQVGACDPNDAAGIWAEGLKERSAAYQYSVMDADLKAEYARQLETSAPNWVTGLSSPWVDRYQILKAQSPDENSRIFELLFSTAASTGPAGDYKATLHLAREGNFWRITKIDADPGLYPYTRFKP